MNKQIQIILTIAEIQLLTTMLKIGVANQKEDNINTISQTNDLISKLQHHIKCIS